MICLKLLRWYEKYALFYQAVQYQKGISVLSVITNETDNLLDLNLDFSPDFLV
jgi:hypothetical protein